MTELMTQVTIIRENNTLRCKEFITMFVTCINGKLGFNGSFSDGGKLRKSKKETDPI